MEELKEDLNKMQYLVEIVDMLKMMITTEYWNLYSESVNKKFATDLITRGKLEVWHNEMQFLTEMLTMIESV